MLTYRLNGTTEVRCLTGTDSAIVPLGNERGNGRSRHTIFARHGEPQEALHC
jgi:hypothetical protein